MLKKFIIQVWHCPRGVGLRYLYANYKPKSFKKIMQAQCPLFQVLKGRHLHHSPLQTLLYINNNKLHCFTQLRGPIFFELHVPYAPAWARNWHWTDVPACWQIQYTLPQRLVPVWASNLHLIWNKSGCLVNMEKTASNFRLSIHVQGRHRNSIRMNIP